LDPKDRLQRFKVTSTVIVLLPTLTLVVYAVLSKVLDWSSMANLVALAVCGTAQLAAFVTQLRRAGTLMLQMPVRENGAPFDPVSPTVSKLELERYERSQHVLGSRRGRLITGGAIALVATLAIVETLLPASVRDPLRLFAGGFAVLSVERSVASLQLHKKRWYDEAQYRPSTLPIELVAYSAVRWFVVAIFAWMTVGAALTSLWSGTVFIVGGILGWMLVRRLNSWYGRVIDGRESVSPL
jgi:hypothetical protein